MACEPARGLGFRVWLIGIVQKKMETAKKMETTIMGLGFRV